MHELFSNLYNFRFQKKQVDVACKIFVQQYYHAKIRVLYKTWNSPKESAIFDSNLMKEVKDKIAARINQLCDDVMDLNDCFLEDLLQWQRGEFQQLADCIRFKAVKHN